MFKAIATRGIKMNINVNTETNSHPLDRCSAVELEAAVALLKQSGNLSEEAFFVSGFADEPDKEVVLSFKVGTPFERVIRLIGHDPKQKQSFDARVSLTKNELAQFLWIEDGQAAVTGVDVIKSIKLLYTNSDWLEAMSKRGIEDLSLVHVEPWVAGRRPEGMSANARAFSAIFFLHKELEDNHYARPVEGLIAHVDLDSDQVIIEDHGVVPIPEDDGEYAANRVQSLRQDLKPLEIIQPEGPSFEVEGQVIRWQKWKMHVSLNPVEGLVLHDVRYDDDGKDRPILYRASLSDMVVPYGDSSPMHNWKHALDSGETNMGHGANSLSLGCDCLGEIYYFDNTILKSNGEAQEVKNVICLHEEDYGVLWKHTNMMLEKPIPEVRRSRRLVVSCFHTVGNYEYGFYWYFYQDGTIQMEVKLTGHIGVSVVPDGLGTDTSPMVAPMISSPIHQHLFCFRLDFNLDGAQNTVCETNVEALPVGPDNPLNSGFRAVTTSFKSESEAKREVDPAKSRSWKVINAGVRNQVDQPVGYKLLPQSSPVMLSGDQSLPAKRGAFAKHNLWVTPYRSDELYADAGPFANLHSGEAGLPAYTSKDRAIDDTDLVVWHTFGVTHVPRPEDWPIMPVEYAGFTLLPVGFFDQNPALDVPPPSKACHD